MSDRVSKLNLADVSQVPATCMGMHVRRASRIITQVYDSALRPLGLGVNQFMLLAAVYLVESVSITQLAEELFTDQTTLTRNLKVLEKRQLVAIATGEDRRVRLVSLTAEGESILVQAFPLWEQAQAQVREHLGQQKCQTLLSLLSEMKTLG